MCSRVLSVVQAFGRGSHDARVRAHSHIRLGVDVLVGGHVLALVVAAAVSQHNLRRVFVGHHHAGLGQARAVGQGVVGLQRLGNHTSVERRSHLEDITKALNISSVTETQIK